MHTQPRGEGDGAVEFVPLLADRRHGGVAPDHRHDSLVVIMKWSSSLAGDFGQDIFRSPRSALLGNRTQLWQHLIIRAENVREVAQCVNSWKARNSEVRSHFDPTPAPPRQPCIFR